MRQVKAPFVAVIGGEEFTFRDLGLAGRRQVRASQDGMLAMRMSLGDEQWARFLALPKGSVTDWKLVKLAGAIARHYGRDILLLVPAGKG